MDQCYQSSRVRHKNRSDHMDPPHHKDRSVPTPLPCRMDPYCHMVRLAPLQVHEVQRDLGDLKDQKVRLVRLVRLDPEDLLVLEDLGIGRQPLEEEGVGEEEE